MKCPAFILALAPALVLGLSSSNASAQNLLTNGGFETGDFTGWIQDPFTIGNTSNAVYSGIYCCQGALPPEGTFAAAFGGGGNTTGEIAQTFATTSGVTYTGSLQYAGVGGPNDGNLQVTLGDAINLTVLSSSGALEPAFNGTWSTYTFSFVATSALSGIDILSPNGPATDYNVDNVRVVPEPANIILFALGTLGLFAVARRRK